MSDDVCHCLRGDGKPCRGVRCGPKYPWDRPKKNAAAIFAAIKALNNPSKLNSNAAIGRCPCASGSWASDAKSIFKAIKTQNVARCAANFIPTDWFGRAEWENQQWDKYKELMEEKHALRELAEANAT